MRTLFLAACLAAATACAARPAAAGPAPAPLAQQDSARAAATAWLPLVDEGRYGEAWDRASTLFRDAFPRDRWEQAAAAARGRVGALESRRLADVQRTDSLPGAPPGDYVILQFESEFEGAGAARELVTVMKEPDGSWAVAGYFVTPAAP